MIDNDIITALECCTKHHYFTNCPLRENNAGCITKLMSAARDIINRQKTEIERLKAENKTSQTERDQWYAEYHNVKYDLKQSRMNENSAHKLAEDYIAKFRTARAEAINDFAEKVKENRSKIFNTIYSDYHFGEIIDRLAEEMEGEYGNV